MFYSFRGRENNLSENTTYEEVQANEGQQSQMPPRRKSDWKPIILRKISLVGLCLLTIGLIGLVQYAIHKLPHRLEVYNSPAMETASSPRTPVVRTHMLVRDTDVPGFTRTNVDFSISPPSTGNNILAVETASLLATPDETSYSTASEAYVPETVLTFHFATDSAFLVETPTFSTTSDEYFAGTPTAVTPPPLGSAAKSEYVAPTGYRNRTTTGTQPSRGDALDVNGTVYKWNAWQVFESAYLPVLLAVLYRVLWAVVYSNASLIEPFQQLAKAEGAPAEYVFFSFYQAQSNFKGPFIALINRSWNLAFIASAYVLASILPALMSEAFVVNTNWQCPESERTESNFNPCPPYLEVSLPILRTVQAVLIVEALALIFAIGHSLLRSTGLPANPSSIAAIGSLVRSPALHHVMDEVSAAATTYVAKTKLQGKQFRLAYYQAEHGNMEYGIVPSANYIGCPIPLCSHCGQEHSIEDNSLLSGKKEAAASRLRVLDFVLLIVVSGTFAIVLAYYLDGGDNSYNRFFSSDTFGPRFILTGACTAIASIWKSVEQDSMISAVYQRMASKPSSPASTILFTPSVTPVFSTTYTIMHGYHFVATLTLMAFMGEGISVVVGGVPFAAGQTWKEFLVSTYMSLAILGLMTVISAIVIFQRLFEPKMPRKPESLFAVMSYTYSSSMLSDFDDITSIDEESSQRKIEALNKRYEFKKTVLADGRYAWRVDRYIPETGDEG